MLGQRPAAPIPKAYACQRARLRPECNISVADQTVGCILALARMLREILAKFKWTSG
jgi:hypothetical protein